MQVIDFDEIETWGPWVATAIEKVAPKSLLPELRSGKSEFIEEACDIVLTNLGRDVVLDSFESDFTSRYIRLHHGTRLTSSETSSVQSEGLKPLVLSNRVEQLRTILAKHPRWTEVEANFESTLLRFGQGNTAGRREDGCVHACFSRSALLSGCSHYLAYGAEVDSYIAYDLFDDNSALELLQQGRSAKIVSFTVPFREAMKAANPNGVSNSDLPSLITILLGAWAYQQVYPNFTVTSQKDCVAARFDRSITTKEIYKVCSVDDADIDFSRA